MLLTPSCIRLIFMRLSTGVARPSASHPDKYQKWQGLIEVFYHEGQPLVGFASRHLVPVNLDNRSYEKPF